MHIITDPSEVADPQLRRLLQNRFEQPAGYDCPINELARFQIIEPGDDVDELLTNAVDGSCYGHPDFVPSWEWIEDHGCWFEAAFILDDSGFGHVYFVPDRDGIDPDLLSLCRASTAASEGKAR